MEFSRQLHIRIAVFPQRCQRIGWYVNQLFALDRHQRLPKFRVGQIVDSYPKGCGNPLAVDWAG